MSGMSVKRLMQELKELTLRPPEGIVAGPIDDDSIYEWDAYIAGPQGTPYDGACFRCTISFPVDYPMSPPVMRFTDKVWHPNVYPDGKVCVSILHAPGEDRFGYERSCERWSPVQSVEKVLLSVVSMLAEPNDESPANVDAAVMWRKDREAYERKCDDCVRMSLSLPTRQDEVTTAGSAVEAVAATAGADS